MNQWLRNDAVYDLAFVAGIAIVLTGAWLISVPHAMVLAGLMLVILVLHLRARR